MSTSEPVHVVSADEVPGRRHQPSPGCWCGPIASFRTLEKAEPVYRHRTPPTEKRYRVEPSKW